jgi:DNA polymerase III subunit delta'
MSWNNILGQERVKTILRDIYIQERIPNAFLFYGNEGVGKEATAIELAKTLNCTTNENNEERNFEPCNECSNCRTIDKLQHTNIKLVFALPRGKNETEHDDNPLNKMTPDDLINIKNELLEKAKNKYYPVNIQGANEIRMISIRDIKKTLSLASTSGAYRVIVISNAEKMNVESANAFLKILEEPPKNTLFILTTSKKDNILPTILSRCQELFFDTLSNEDVLKGLNHYFSGIGEKAEFLARLSKGSFSNAIKMLDENYNDIRNNNVDFLRLILSNKYPQIFSELDELIAAKDKVKIEFKLVLLMNWFRDIILVKEGLKDIITNSDQLEAIESFYNRLPKSDLFKAIEEVEYAIQLMQQNVSLQLILYNMMINLRKFILKQ